MVAAAETPVEGVSASTCDLFTTRADVRACRPEADDIDDAVLDLLVQAASDYVSEVLGRQFRGLCQSTVQPIPECGCGHGPAWSDGGWWWPPGPGCSCGPYPTIDLGADPVPPDGIVSVEYEGDAIDAATYRVDRRRWLVRLDDADGSNPGWPRPVRPASAEGNTGNLTVVYVHGWAVPSLAQLAALAVAVEFTKACPGTGGETGDCQLPPNVTQVIRQGTTMRLSDLVDAMGRSSLSALPAVADAVEAYNPRRQRSWAVVDDPAGSPVGYPT